MKRMILFISLLWICSLKGNAQQISEESQLRMGQHPYDTLWLNIRANTEMELMIKHADDMKLACKVNFTDSKETSSFEFFDSKGEIVSEISSQQATDLGFVFDQDGEDQVRVGIVVRGDIELTRKITGGGTYGNKITFNQYGYLTYNGFYSLGENGDALYLSEAKHKFDERFPNNLPISSYQKDEDGYTFIAREYDDNGKLLKYISTSAMRTDVCNIKRDSKGRMTERMLDVVSLSYDNEWQVGWKRLTYTYDNQNNRTEQEELGDPHNLIDSETWDAYGNGIIVTSDPCHGVE